MKKQATLLEETRESAIAVLEDIRHLGSVVAKAETQAVDLRHASAILRRLLVEGTLRRVANPRIGKIELSAIDNTPIYKTVRKGAIEHYITGGAPIHGILAAAGMVNKGKVPPSLEGFDPFRHIKLNVDSFLKQRVIFTEGTWLTRRDVIKYVANVAAGVHDGKTKDATEKRLAEFRYRLTVTLIDPRATEGAPADLPADVDLTPQIAWSHGPAASESSPADYDPQSINGVLVELLAAMHHLVISDDVKRLCKAIANEI